MQPDFWHERWQHGEIGFHRAEVHPALRTHWPTLELPVGSRVLVPLCGKSLDLRWLAEQGHEVVGVELSHLACAAFFDDAGLQPRCERDGAFVRWQAGSITILQGDFFDLEPTDFHAAYDRAATVALPADLRLRYARKLASSVRSGGCALLVTLDGSRSRETGPPFPVSAEEVTRCYDSAFRVRPLERRALAAGEAPPDLDHEEHYLLTRRS